MGMRNFSALFLVLLVSIGCFADARRDPGDYWRSRMNGDPMPKAITELLNQNRAASDSMKWDRFAKNFETRPNVIIYHGHHLRSEKSKP